MGVKLEPQKRPMGTTATPALTCENCGGPLAKGTLRGEVITCPWHGWQFNVKTGRHCLAPRIRQPRVEVEVRGDDVWVAPEDEPPPAAEPPSSSETG